MSEPTQLKTYVAGDDPALASFAVDELHKQAAELGLEPPANTEREAIVELIRARRELLVELDREALLDVVVWGRRRVRRSAPKEQLAREIALVQRTSYHSLSTRGLCALARLRGIAATPTDSAGDLIDRLKKADGFLGRLQRKGRSFLAGWVANMIEGGTAEPVGEYQFLPEDDAAGEGSRPSIRHSVEEHGLVGGIAQRLRGAADDYIKIKLDEIEARIDAKLNQIDLRLGEWRDREVANRLKILRLTLMFSVLVALVSLGYNMVKSRISAGTPTTTRQSAE